MAGDSGHNEAMKTKDLHSIYWLVAAIVIVRAAIQILVINEYGYFVDEFYYLACSDRLASGYVDHPPLSIWILKFVRVLFGDSLAAIRSVSILAGALTVILSARLAYRLGAGCFGISFAALAVAIVPVYLGMNKLYSMNSLDLVFWTGSIVLLLRVLERPTLANWAVLGVLLGVALLNKHSILFLGFAIAVGLLFTSHRRLFLTPGPYLTGTLALVLFAPNLYWEIQNHWPTLEFMENARAFKNYFTPAHFLVGQVLEIHPLLPPLWLLGLGALLLTEALRPFRILAFMYLALLVLFLATAAKTYYFAPAYPMLLAAGAFQLERLSDARRGLRGLAIALTVLGGGALLPMSLPLLAPPDYIAYQKFLGLEPPQLENHRLGPMPQHFASMFGWPELVEAAGEATASLSETERAEAVFLGSSYGMAGALEWARNSGRDLPAVGSGHNNYYQWGPPIPDSGRAPRVILAVGYERTDLEPYCGSLQVASVARCEYCMGFRQELPIYVCRAPRSDLSELWPEIKRFI